MAFFSYRGTDHSGKTVEGRMEAQDAGAVATRLQELGFFPLGIIPAVETEEAGGGEGASAGSSAAKGRTGYTSPVNLPSSWARGFLSTGLSRFPRSWSMMSPSGA